MTFSLFLVYILIIASIELKNIVNYYQLEREIATFSIIFSSLFCLNRTNCHNNYRLEFINGRIIISVAASQNGAGSNVQLLLLLLLLPLAGCI
jgi:hypothetical protein